MSIGVAVFGATGSIGLSTLDVVRRNPALFHVSVLAAYRNADRLLEQIQEFQPKHAVLVDESRAPALASRVKAAGLETQVHSGADAVVALAREDSVDVVMAAIVGAAGLPSTMAAIESGKTLLLANKESLVCGGSLVMNAVKQHNAILLPIDSEHNAIYQCLATRKLPAGPSVRRILLTGSGGPFRLRPLETFAEITRDEATVHPNWSMGPKITVDSATMMNKGLELIETCRLFEVDESRIEVVLHPESIVHSMVEYCDGSVLAQMGAPDMRTPIAHCMAVAKAMRESAAAAEADVELARLSSGSNFLDFTTLGSLSFSPPDRARFPALDLARGAAKAGGCAPIYLNAANEVAVAQFLAGNLGFLDIVRLVEKTMEIAPSQEPASIEEVLHLDAEARRVAASLIG